MAFWAVKQEHEKRWNSIEYRFPESSPFRESVLWLMRTWLCVPCRSSLSCDHFYWSTSVHIWHTNSLKIFQIWVFDRIGLSLRKTNRLIPINIELELWDSLLLSSFWLKSQRFMCQIQKKNPSCNITVFLTFFGELDSINGVPLSGRLAIGFSDSNGELSSLLSTGAICSNLSWFGVITWYPQKGFA